MRIVKLSVLCVVCGCVALVVGCVSPQQYKELQVQNATQANRITELSSELQATKLQLDQMRRRLAAAEETGGIEVEALRQKVAALESAVEKKNALIAMMQGQLLGGVQLPVELSTMLEDFARGQDMVTYDASRGIVKFKSDLLFERGSDVVAAAAAEAVRGLCGIMNSEEGKGFDIIIAGHTDDIPIGRPETRKRHPSNWHLSVHRAISVLKIMESGKIDSTRLSVRGFGEFRPVAANKPNKKGNPQNRRVEIYIVPKGT